MTMPPKDNEQAQPEVIAKPSPVEAHRENLQSAPDLPYALRLRRVEQEHDAEVRAAVDKAVPPMADPLMPQPGYVSEAKAEEDKLLAEQEKRRQKEGAAASERLAAVADARRKADEAEAEARRLEHQALLDARR
jgi:hypothetical protein